MKLPYTYEITVDDKGKVDARRKLAGMSIEVIEKMRDEMIDVAIVEWLEYRRSAQDGSR